MSGRTRSRDGAGSPRRWYWLAGAVATATVVATGAVALDRVTGLIEQVEGFDRFSAPGGTALMVTEPGDYGVYNEYSDIQGNPYGGEGEVTVMVTGPDGRAVEVRPSEVSYGWGSRKAEAVGEFTAEQPGSYRVRADGDGRLAVGERVPPGPLRGLGTTLLAASTVLVGCLALVVSARRRQRRGWVGGGPGVEDPAVSGPAAGRFAPAGPHAVPGGPEGDPGVAGPSPGPAGGFLARSPSPGAMPGSPSPGSPSPGSPSPGGTPAAGTPGDGLTANAAGRSRRPAWLVPVVALVALVGGIVAVDRGMEAMDDAGDRIEAGARGPEARPSSCAGLDVDDPATCLPSFEELRETNLRYADRYPFEGDRAAATAVAEEVRAALAPLAPVLPSPSAEQVRQALAPWAPRVSTNAVRTSGTAFGISVGDGCVFGSVWQGQVEVEVGGYVRDGGCLASYGH